MLLPAPIPLKSHWPIVVLAAALLLLISIFFINRARSPRLAVLAIRVSPAGASVHVNDQVCPTPNCEYRLQPGQYRIQASAPGYQEKIETVTLRPGSSESPRMIALEPLSPSLRITANFPDGDVTLDNLKAGSMQDGQFVVERLAPGRHSLRISGRDGSASASFDADYAKLPVISNVLQQNADVIASGSFGNRARIVCAGCTGSVSIDGRPVGVMQNGALTIENVPPGTHHLKVGNDHSLVFTAAKAPGIDLALNSGGNLGLLVVETDEDNATVFVDGVKYPHPTSRGQLKIPTEATQHTIRVSKSGYRSEPLEIRAQVMKGDRFPARFKLTAEPARLVVSRQLVGAAVLIDGSPVGIVGPDGAFSTPVPAGDHRIEFKKDGYVAAQVQRLFEAGKRVTVSRTDAPLLAKAVPPPLPAPEIPAATHAPDTAPLQQAEERQKQHANAAREETWNATDKTNKAALQQFLSKYGDGLHAQDARTMLAAIEKQESEELAVAQRAQEQAGVMPPMQPPFITL